MSTLDYSKWDHIEQPPAKRKKVYHARYKQNYAPEQMKCAYDMCKEGHVTVYRAAKLCGVPERTLRDRTLGLCDPYNSKAGRIRLLNEPEEAALVAFIEETAECGYGYTRKEIALLAGETAFFLKKRATNVALNRKWVRALLNKWPNLKMITMQKNTSTDSYCRKLLVILQKYDLLEKPHRIFSVDETTISVAMTKSPTPQGVATDKSTTTLISCVSASGQCIALYLVFKGKRKSGKLLAGMLPDSQGTVSETGLSNSVIFQKYLTEHFLRHVPTKKDDPLLVLHDVSSSHVNAPLIEWALKHNIILFPLPPCASRLTRSSHVSIFDSFKLAYNSECQTFVQKNSKRTITRHDMCRLVGNASRHTLTPGNIIDSFRRAGIFPFDAIVITSEKPAASTTENLSTEQSCDDQYAEVASGTSVEDKKSEL